MSAKEPYEQVRPLVKRISGIDVPRSTVSRWIAGLKKYGRSLKVIRVGNKVLTTESELRAFLEYGGGHVEKASQSRPAKRSERSREREVAAAEASSAADLA